MRHLYFLLIFFLFVNALRAQEIIEINSRFEAYKIGKQVYYFEDKTGQVTIDQILTGNYQKKFIKSNSEILNFGITSSSIWIKLTIRADTHLTDRFFVEIDKPVLDQVWFYHLNEKGKYIGKVTGSKYNLFTKDYVSTNFGFQLDNFNKVTRTFYIKVKTTTGMVLPFRAGTILPLSLSLYKDVVFMSIYFGIIILSAFYNLIIFFIFKEKSYLYYVLYILVFGLFMADVKGYTKLAFPYINWINIYSDSIYYITYILILLFSKKFLKLKFYFKKYNYFLTALIGLYSIFLIFDSFNIKLYNYLRWFNFFEEGVFLSLVVVSFLVHKKGYKPALFYFIGWSAFVASANIFDLSINNIIPYSWYTDYFFPIGSFIEIILFGYGLTHRISMLKDEKEEILEENLKLSLKQNTVLEEKVKERTLELQEKNEEIATFNDYLTKTINDRTHELDLTIENLSKQNESMAQFSFIVSHNLRAPLARLLGLSQIFNKENLADEFNIEVIERIKASAIDLDTIIFDLNNVLLIKRKINLSIQKIEVKLVFDSVFNILEKEIKASNASISLHISTIPFLLIDNEYFKSIVYHLVSNAIKFRVSKRSCEIEIATYIREDKFILEIKDNGMGINLDKTDPYKVFGLYQRMHTHVTGKGLGLYLVKLQTEAMNGNVNLESIPNSGTKCTVSFPKEIVFAS